jgi:hypothetical protein
VVKKKQILFATGLRRLGAQFALLSEKPRWPASNRPSTSRVKEGIGEI